jgi:hypothetical protein
MISRATRVQPIPAAPINVAPTITAASTTSATAIVTGVNRLGRGSLRPAAG